MRLCFVAERDAELPRAANDARTEGHRSRAGGLAERYELHVAIPHRHHPALVAVRDRGDGGGTEPQREHAIHARRVPAALEVAQV